MMRARLCCLVLAASSGVAAAALPDLNGVWLAVNPPNALHTAEGSPPPLLPDAQRIYEQHLAARKNGDVSFDPTSSCKPPGLPRALTLGLFEILQEPAQVFFLFEWNREVRMIDLGISHPQQNIYGPTYFGFSTGAWNADTLTVDTVSLNDTTILDTAGLPHSEDLHLIETYRLKKDGKTLVAHIRVEDSRMYVRPWDTVLTFKRQPQDAQIQEDVCLERQRLSMHQTNITH